MLEMIVGAFIALVGVIFGAGLAQLNKDKEK